MSTQYKKYVKTLRLNFEQNSMEFLLDCDSNYELRDFFAQVEPQTAKEEDIHVMFAYFGLYWPFKTIYHNGKKVNYPQTFRGLYVR